MDKKLFVNRVFQISSVAILSELVFKPDVSVASDSPPIRAALNWPFLSE